MTAPAAPPRRPRILVTGASGAGTSTLGRALASRLGVASIETDDIVWYPGYPPFQDERPDAERLALLRAAFAGAAGWVVSGSLDDWGDPLAAAFDLVVLVETPTDERLRRLRQRERQIYGARAVGPGGPLHESIERFYRWAEAYESGGRPGRSRALHEAFLERAARPSLRLDGTRPVAQLVRAVIAALEANGVDIPRGGGGGDSPA